MIRTDEPSTDAELFDFIHSLFGIGDYDEDDKKPYHRFRMTEIAKIKAIRKKRRLSIVDLTMVARYAANHGYTVTSTFDLLHHLPDALRERARNTRSQVEIQLDEAVQWEREHGGHESEQWVDRLLRSSGAGRIDLLEEWKATRKRSLAGAADG